jgi:MoxR-like ATPase
LNAAKAYAAISGRDFVNPEDVVFVTAPVLRHRIIITPEKEMEGGTPDEVIQEILQTIEVPR